MYHEGSTSNNLEITEEEEDNISQAQRSVLQAQQHQYQSSNPVNPPPPPPPPPLPLPRLSPQSPQELITALTPKETDHVTLFVAYNGEWEYDNKEWIFNNSEGSMLVVPKHIKLSEMIEILYDKFCVNNWLYRFKLEVHWTRSSWFPVIEIRNDQDLSMFISESSKKELPLCVTLLNKDVDEERRKDYVTVFVSYDGEWDLGGEGWFFKNPKSSTVFVPKHITLSEIVDILYKHLDVNKKLYRFQLKVQHGTEYPSMIENNRDLLRFISKTSETKLPLCVTRRYKAIGSDVAGERRKGTVKIFVAYDGKWEYNGEEWFFKNSKSGIMLDIPKHITLSEINDILHDKLSLNKKLYRLKLEVHYRTGSPWFPIIEIQDDEDLSQFISETSKTKVPLCVTRLEENYLPDVDEQRRKDDTVENRLLKAIRKNDWVKAREIVNTKEVTWTSKLDEWDRTALHFAVGEFKDNDVVKDILKGIDGESLLTIVDNYGWHPVHTAAIYGNTEALKKMLKSNPECSFIPSYGGDLAINFAINFLEIETFQYLFKQMQTYKDEFDTFLRGDSGLELLGKVIDTGLIDVAYELINNHQTMAAKVLREDVTLLQRIIRKPELFYSGTHYNLYQRFVYRYVPIENISLDSSNTTDIENNSLGDTADEENQETRKKDKSVTDNTRRCHYDVISMIWDKLWKTTLQLVPLVKHLKDEKVQHNTTVKLLDHICKEVDRSYKESDILSLYSSPFCLAVENNTAEAIHVLTTYFEGLYGSRKDGKNIYELIVLNRSEKVYNFIMNHRRDAKSEISIANDYDGNNNILHLAGLLAPIHKLNASSGAALQMQRELQWFEEVKRVVGIAQTRELNKNKETPMMVFRREHEKLRKDGEEWMKKTADSYTITAALIITIVFAAAITVPGGNDSTTGKPIYQTKSSLIIFAISDAISLFTSTTSLLLFLSILTARYAEEDFLYKLPKRLIFGLVMLFLSVTSMMIAFSATLYIMFGQEKQWILIPIGALACLPIASFVTLQFPLLVELISSTYGHGMFGKEKDYKKSKANANKEKRA